ERVTPLGVASEPLSYHTTKTGRRTHKHAGLPLWMLGGDWECPQSSLPSRTSSTRAGNRSSRVKGTARSTHSRSSYFACCLVPHTLGHPVLGLRTQQSTKPDRGPSSAVPRPGFVFQPTTTLRFDRFATIHKRRYVVPGYVWPNRCVASAIRLDLPRYDA